MRGRLVVGTFAIILFTFTACGKEIPKGEDAGNEASVEIEEVIAESEQLKALSGVELLMKMPFEEVLKSPVYDYSGEWNSQVYKLAELPKQDILMFGYADGGGFASGVAIAHKGHVSYFDWLYASAHGAMPELYWKEEDKQLLVCLHPASGTGYSVDELHILCEDASMQFKDYGFSVGEYGAMLKERVEYAVVEEDGRKLIRFTDKEEAKELVVLDVTKYLLGDAGECAEVKDVFMSDMVTFSLGESIQIQFTPGFLPEGGYVVFDDMPVFQASIELGTEGTFTIGEITAVK